MRALKRSALVLSLAVILASSSAFAIKVTSDPNFDLNINVLLQPRFQGDWDGVPPAPTSTAPDGPSATGKFNADLFIKRARLVARGSAFKYFQFLITLDTPNFGARGNYGFLLNNETFIQDLVMTVVPIQDLWIDFGFLLVPLSHGSVSNPAAQSAIDAPGSILAGRLMNNASRASREAGLQIRTLLLDHRILFRGGVYEGARSSQGVNAPGPNEPILNPSGRPMVGGMLRFNFVGDEVTFPGYPGIYMDGKSRVSVGAGGQWQSKAAVGANVAGADAYPDYVATAADVFVDIALPAENELVFQLNGYHFDYGAGNARTGYGAAGDLGYRIGPIEPQFNFYWFNSDSKNASMLKWAFGVNYFFKGHDAKLGLEFDGMISSGFLPSAQNPTPTLHQIVLQGQLAF